jgi:ABC-type transport system involved in cytochrome c biogenesis permease subunit
MNPLQSRKFWIVVGVLAALLALLGICTFWLPGSEATESVLCLAGKLIAAVEVIVLGYLGANVIGKAADYLRGRNGGES